MRVCVFASSSSLTPEPYLKVRKNERVDKTRRTQTLCLHPPSCLLSSPSPKVARELGEEIAKAGYLCINGGGKNGCMGALNEGARALGGKVR